MCGFLAACTPQTSPVTEPGAAQSKAAPPSGPAQDRPNIIFVLTDDLSSDLVRYMPRVRAMQRVGTTFTNHFVVNSLCCPSRASILTGKYPHNTGVLDNSAPDGGYRAWLDNDNDRDTFALALQRAGYRTALMGKYLNAYRVKNRPAPGWDEWQVADYAYGEYDYKLRNNDRVEQHGRKPSDYMTDLLSDRATAFVDQASAAGDPFMLVVSTFAPHAPATPAPRDRKKLPGLKAPRPKSFNRPVSDPPQWMATLPRIKVDKTNIDRRYRNRALAALAIDQMVGRLQQQLRAKGLADNTYFVFSSDNGYHMGEYRLLPGKQTPYDMDVRVPLVVTGPGVPAGRRVRELTSSVDLAPTFEAIGGAPARPRRIDGTSMLPLWHGRKPSGWRRSVLIEHNNQDRADPADPDYQASRHGDPPNYEAVRTSNALYVQYVAGEREYYDLTRDPYQLRNLARKAPAARLAALQKRLNALRTCAGNKECSRAAR